MTTRRFEGRRALVTGASRGIGAGVAERLAAEGADVVLTARTVEADGRLPGSLAETAARLKRYGGLVALVAADLTDEADRARLIPDAVSALGGPIDILVNNAAASIQEPLASISLKRRRIMFEVNVQAPLDLAQAAIPAMVEAGEGWIVNVSSGAARPRQGPPFASSAHGSTIAAYGASKAALSLITNGLAVELYGAAVRVNAVQPRAAVLSEGAAELSGEKLRPDQIESLEDMVEAVAALCACPDDATGLDAVSQNLIADWGLEVRALDGSRR